MKGFCGKKETFENQDNYRLSHISTCSKCTFFNMMWSDICFMVEWVCECLLLNAKWVIFKLEHVTFQWDDGDICPVLDQDALLALNQINVSDSKWSDMSTHIKIQQSILV
jgi:hypothetical protein